MKLETTLSLIAGMNKTDSIRRIANANLLAWGEPLIDACDLHALGDNIFHIWADHAPAGSALRSVLLACERRMAELAR